MVRIFTTRQVNGPSPQGTLQSEAVAVNWDPSRHILEDIMLTDSTSRSN
jgi:hypothetical protein